MTLHQFLQSGYKKHIYWSKQSLRSNIVSRGYVLDFVDKDTSMDVLCDYLNGSTGQYKSVIYIRSTTPKISNLLKTRAYASFSVPVVIESTSPPPLLSSIIYGTSTVTKTVKSNTTFARLALSRVVSPLTVPSPTTIPTSPLIFSSTSLSVRLEECQLGVFAGLLTSHHRHHSSEVHSLHLSGLQSIIKTPPNQRMTGVSTYFSSLSHLELHHTNFDISDVLTQLLSNPDDSELYLCLSATRNNWGTITPDLIAMALRVVIVQVAKGDVPQFIFRKIFKKFSGARRLAQTMKHLYNSLATFKFDTNKIYHISTAIFDLYFSDPQLCYDWFLIVIAHSLKLVNGISAFSKCLPSEVIQGDLASSLRAKLISRQDRIRSNAAQVREGRLLELFLNNSEKFKNDRVISV
ncbi:hypothetical protein GEMRC1_011843 [Eukaryota sp. GEM-RC1]